MSFDIQVFRSKFRGEIRSLNINSGVTLATCQTCTLRKENCEKYVREPSNMRTKSTSVYNRVHTHEYWFCSNECLNFYILKYLL